MSRWQPNTRERLERAALELFTEQGFAETTVPEITARAGLTTRTFFRYFSDKREVLFASETEMPVLAARIIAEAPGALTPMQVIVSAFDQVAAAQFSAGAEFFVAKHSIIASDDSLRERQMRKMAALTNALHQGFVDRGADEITASLTAQVTTTVFGTAIGRWLGGQGEVPLADLLHDTLARFREVAADPSWAQPGPDEV